MQESLRSPDIYNPKTISEVLSIRSRNPHVQIWGGGTYIMAQKDYFPNPEARDIIRLNSIPELFRIQHSDRFIEVGSMVTIQHVITNGSTILSKDVINAFSNIGNSIIRNTATIGGSLAIPSFRNSICCILATIGATAELRFFNRKNYSRWISVSKLYDSEGNFLYNDKAIITKIRIPAEDKEFAQFFVTLDSPLQNKNNAVEFGLQYTISQGNISLPTICICYPESGFLYSGEIENRISTVNLPISPENTSIIASQTAVIIRKSYPNVSEIQIERTTRLIEKILFDINSRYLGG